LKLIQISGPALKRNIMYNYKGWTFPDIDSHFRSWVGEFPETTYQQGALDAAFKHVKKFDVAIDAGANIGLQSVRLAQKFNQVHSFEPTSVNHDCLINNVKIFSNVQVYKTGLGEREESAIIKLPIESKNCGAFSIIDFNSYVEPVLSEQITISPLDKFQLSPDFIKIDTQGFELFILKGAENTLKNKPVLLLECEKKQEKQLISSYLIPLGYTIIETVRKDSIWIVK
jgi:FkbM family methyltransferase